MFHSSPEPGIAPSDPSWWFADALKQEGGEPPAPGLTGEIAVDVAVVGGGYTGMWTALALKRRKPDLRVALIEASLCGGEASGKNGGVVHGYWASLPGLIELLGPNGALAIARAGARAQAGLRAFAKEADRDVWLREGGSLRVSTTPSQDIKVARMVEAARGLGVADMARHCPRRNWPHASGRRFYAAGYTCRKAARSTPPGSPAPCARPSSAPAFSFTRTRA